MQSDPQLLKAVASYDYPLMFVTISGAHLYGFPSPDSDVDLRGVHLLPPIELLGLNPCRDTIELSQDPERPGDLELDLVTHDLEKFIRMMLKRNGYVLEQLYSPLVVATTPEHEELKTLGEGCITCHHVHHYLGFARNQWALFSKDAAPRIKPLLYVYRVLLTGIHLMRSGEVQANLVTLNQAFRLTFIDDLVARKAELGEHSVLTDADIDFHRQEYERLMAVLAEAGENTTLRDEAISRDGINDLLVRCRLG